MNKKIRTFFDRHIVKMHSSNANNSLGAGISAKAPSYFEAPKRPDYIYLNQISFDKAGLEQHLADLWRDEPELLKAIPDLVKLAFTLKEENIQQSEELAPFLYAMF